MVVNTAVNANSNVIPAVPMREVQAPSGGCMHVK